MKLTREMLNEYISDVCYIEYDINNENGVIIYDIEKIKDNQYKEILSKYLFSNENIDQIKHKIINYMNELDNFTTTIKYFNSQGVQKMFCYIGYKKEKGYFIDLCETPYKLAININNQTGTIEEFNIYHNILKDALFEEKGFLNIILNLISGKIECLNEIEWMFHEKNLSSMYSTKNIIKIDPQTLDEATKKQQYTKVMLQNIENENIATTAFDYCKKIKSFVHCPIKLNDYKRMEEYTKNKELINQVYKTLKEIKQPIGNNTITANNKIFFWYSIALLSETDFNREEYDKYFKQLIVEVKNNYKINKNDFDLLKRNFEILKKEYKYLEKYFIAMENYLVDSP